MKRRAFLAGVASTACFSGARAGELISNATALSGDRFTSGEAEFRLADIMAPPLYTLSETTPAYFADSRNALQAIITGAFEIEDVLPVTRWSVRRVKARAADSQETLQEMLVAQGAVRVAPQSEDHAFIARLLMLESVARDHRRGLWARPDYRVYNAASAWGALNSYHLVEGVVLRAEQHGSRFYLNFGEDFRSDFTAGAASRLYRRWVKSGIDLGALKGASVRVRGLVEAINGPSIDLKHPLQIERLG